METSQIMWITLAVIVGIAAAFALAYWLRKEKRRKKQPFVDPFQVLEDPMQFVRIAREIGCTSVNFTTKLDWGQKFNDAFNRYRLRLTVTAGGARGQVFFEKTMAYWVTLNIPMSTENATILGKAHLDAKKLGEMISNEILGEVPEYVSTNHNRRIAG